MPDYELWIEDGNRTLPPVPASSAAHAIAIYGRQLGLHLTIENLGVGAYGTLRETTQKEVRWARREPDIPVWSRGPRIRRGAPASLANSAPVVLLASSLARLRQRLRNHLPDNAGTQDRPRGSATPRQTTTARQLPNRK